MPSIDISNFLCPLSECLYYALDKINSNGKSRIFVINAKMHYVTTLTESDLRQAILSKLPLECNVSEVIELCKNNYRDAKSIYARINTPIDELNMLVNEELPIIPLLGKNNNVIDIYEFKKDFHAPVASPNLSGNELSYLMECIETNWISSQGRFVTEFENALKDYTGTRYGIATSNGTSALHLALKALDIGPGDEVIVPNLTFVATANVVIHAGATPVLVDVEADTWCIDPQAITKAITDKTKAIIPVHLYGQPAKMNEICQIAKIHNLRIIEDCAEAIGASINNLQCGCFGDVGCFSFFGNKIITTGEGGMCVTRDENIAKRIRTLRDHGMDPERKYWHTEVGYNYRITNLQASIGVAQMERIQSTLEKRNKIRERYDAAFLPSEKVKSPMPFPGSKHVTWLVSYLLDKSIDRDRFIAKAQAEGVDVRPFFYPMNDMPPYKEMCPHPTPVTKELSYRGINLPTSLGYSNDDYTRIIKVLQKLLNAE